MSVLITVCGYVWRIRRIRRKPKSGMSKDSCPGKIHGDKLLSQVVIGRRVLPDESKRSIIMDLKKWFNGLA